jgi:YD repeat-containing protein
VNARRNLRVFLLEALVCAVKQIAIALLSLAVTVGSLFGADPKKTPAPGTDDLSRYIAMGGTPGGQITLRNASGRTVGTASMAGSRTKTFRDSSGRTTGAASTQGGQTVFRDAEGRTVWTATTSGTKTVTYRAAAGHIQRTASESGNSITFRDAAGRTTSTVQPFGTGATIRDASGRTLGASSTTGGKPPVATKRQGR